MAGGGGRSRRPSRVIQKGELPFTPPSRLPGASTRPVLTTRVLDRSLNNDLWIQPMVRPREFDFEEVAEGLLNAFWLRGFARTSISDLTAATKLLPGSLYAAFGSKEAMFRLALDR